MKLNNLIFLLVVLILIYFDQSTKVEARRSRSLNVQRNDKKLLRAGNFRFIKPKMNKRKYFSLNFESLELRRWWNRLSNVPGSFAPELINDEICLTSWCNLPLNLSFPTNQKSNSWYHRNVGTRLWNWRKWFYRFIGRRRCWNSSNRSHTKLKT